jgi:quinol monooxygenase YgiN
MTTLVITHAVADYDAWKKIFDEHASNRQEHGCLSEELFRSPDAAGLIMNVMRYPSRKAAEEFLGDPSLRAAMSRAGVTGDPRIELWDTAQTSTL